MPTDRIFKFSIPGLMFLFSMIFFDHLLGGNLINRFIEADTDHLLTLISILISSPLIGIVFSTVAVGILQLKFVCGYKIWYYPPNAEIVKYALRDVTELKDSVKKDIEDEAKKKWKKDAIVKKFYPYYQAKVRQHIKDEQMNFLERRWSVYWVHVNNISMIAFSLIIALILRKSSECGFSCLDHDYATHKLIGIGVLILYVFFGIKNACNSRRDATRFEHLMIDNARRDEDKPPIQLILTQS